MRVPIVAATLLVTAWAAQATAQDIRGVLPYRMYRAATGKALSASTSPRDWALASQLLTVNDEGASAAHARVALLQKAAHAAKNDRLVQGMWARASVPVADCGPPPECQARAGALARLEPDNAAAWLPVVNKAVKDGNTQAVDEALDHMAAAARFDEHLGDAMTAWQDVFRRYPPPSLAALKGMAPSGESGTPANLLMDETADSVIAPASGLFDACFRSRNPKLPAARFDRCAKVGRLLIRDATSLIGRLNGFSALRGSGEASKDDVPAIRAVAWMKVQFDKLEVPKNAGIETALVADIGTTGSEVDAIHHALDRAHVAAAPPPDWQWTNASGKPVDLLKAP